MKILKFLDKYFEEILMCMFLLIIVVFMTMQVLARYIFGHALSFPEELCRYSFIWMSYLGVSYAVKTGGQIKVDILQTLLPSLKKPLEIFGDIMYMIFCLLMIGPGIQSVLQGHETGNKKCSNGITHVDDLSVISDRSDSYMCKNDREICPFNLDTSKKEVNKQ